MSSGAMGIHFHIRVSCLTVILLFGLAANVQAAPCDDPMSVFSGSLKNELQNLEKVLKNRFPETDIEKFMSEQKLTLCRDISTKAIDMKRAIEHITLLRYRVFYCAKTDSPEPSALAKDFARKNELTNERVLLAIGRFCRQVSDNVTSQEKYDYIRDLRSELFCIDAVEEMGMLPDFAAHMIQDYPPHARVLAVGKALCERLKKREISVETAHYELKAAQLKESKKLGDSILVNLLAFTAWNVGRNVSNDRPYYWGVMFFVGIGLWVVFFPLYLLGERLDWNWTEGVSKCVFFVYCGAAVLSMLHQFNLDDYSKIFGLLGIIVGIIASVIGAAIGLKKLIGKPESK